MQKQSPLLRIWELGKSEHGRLICAILADFFVFLHSAKHNGQCLPDFDLYAAQRDQ